MPSKKKKYNARFPAGRIKKIMQLDDDVGKIAHAVPVVISRSVELFVNSLLQQTAIITRERNAKTLSLTHTKLCILNEQKFDFLQDLVKNIENVSSEEDKKNNFILPTTSNIETPFNVKSLDDSRKRVKTESVSDFTANPSNDQIPEQKRSRELKKSNSCSLNSTEPACTCPPGSTEDIDPPNHCESDETKLECCSSSDLIIDEECKN